MDLFTNQRPTHLPSMDTHTLSIFTSSMTEDGILNQHLEHTHRLWRGLLGTGGPLGAPLWPVLIRSLPNMHFTGLLSRRPLGTWVMEPQTQLIWGGRGIQFCYTTYKHFNIFAIIHSTFVLQFLHLFHRLDLVLNSDNACT